jgi:sulfur carrier protein ThiS
MKNLMLVVLMLVMTLVANTASAEMYACWEKEYQELKDMTKKELIAEYHLNNRTAVIDVNTYASASDPDTANKAHNLAVVCWEQNDRIKAMLAKRGVIIKEKK